MKTSFWASYLPNSSSPADPTIHRSNSGLKLLKGRNIVKGKNASRERKEKIMTKTARFLLTFPIASLLAVASAHAQTPIAPFAYGTPREIIRALPQFPHLNDIPGSGDMSALMIAAEYNQNDGVIYFLVGAGVDVNAQKNGNGMTALMYAAEYNQNPEIIIALLQCGANTKLKSQGKTALDYAQQNPGLKGNARIQQLLQ